MATRTEESAPQSRVGGKPRKLTNQFNFCERAALTYTNPTRVIFNQKKKNKMSSVF